MDLLAPKKKSNLDVHASFLCGSIHCRSITVRAATVTGHGRCRRPVGVIIFDGSEIHNGCLEMLSSLK